MSIDTTTPVEATEQSLEEFSKVFFGQDTEEPEASTSETTDDDDDASNAPVETGVDTDDEEEDALAPETDEADEAPKPKKNRFQERIDELTHKAREAERRAEAMEREFREKLAKLENPEPPKAQTPVVQDDVGPQPTDTNADGTDKYPLGEFDPQYIRDLTKHTLNVEREAIKAQEQQERERQEIEAQRQTVDEQWQEKLVTARERYPDFTEKGQALVPIFEGVNEQYLDYLTNTVMSMDYGTDVLYYLAQNPSEAENIVKSGATKATIALGRIEARFAAQDSTPTAPAKVTKAPPPPPHVNKGTSAARVEVEDDTDDLEAFKSKFFKKSRGR